MKSFFDYPILKTLYNGIRLPATAICKHYPVIAHTTIITTLTATIVYPLAYIYCHNTDDAIHARAWVTECFFPFVHDLYSFNINPTCYFALTEFLSRTEIHKSIPSQALYGSAFGFFSSLAATTRAVAKEHDSTPRFGLN